MMPLTSWTGRGDSTQHGADNMPATVEPEFQTVLRWLLKCLARGLTAPPPAWFPICRGYRDLIHTAYENVAIVSADPIPDHIKRGQYEISGVVRTGNDERTRGTRDAAPLRIDGTRGHWEEIEELWLAGDLTDDEFEDHFVDDVIVEDIGEGTDGWEFPGASYTVEVR